MCVCVGGWVCVCMCACMVHACVCVCVCVRACERACTLLLLSTFLVFEWFLAPCFIELLMFYC